MDKEQLGRLIRAARHEKGWTQRRLADEYGCSQANISDMERGNISIDLGDLGRLLHVLGKDLHYLLAPGGPALEGLNQAVQVMRSLPRGRIRDEAIASILAIARDAHRRVLERRR